MTSEEKNIQERIKVMREEEIVDFIRVDVIPQLESLATRLEHWMEEDKGQGSATGGNDSVTGSEETSSNNQGTERSTTEGLSEEGRGRQEVRKNLLSPIAARDRNALGLTRSILLRYCFDYRSLFYRRDTSGSM
jgi:hypothetical protein